MRRLLLDSDGHNFFIVCMCDDTEDGIKAAIREQLITIPTEVTTYLISPGCGTYYYPTRVAELMPATEEFPGGAYLHAALAKGLDPFGMFLKAIKQAGMESFISFRMNDVHNPKDKSQWNTPRFRVDHPEMTVDPEANKAENPDWWSFALDYSRKEVRDYYLSILAELIEMYYFDGIMLDWMRWPRTMSGSIEEVREKRDCITEFMCEARRLCQSSGKDILLSARIPSSVQGCKNLGMDIAEWVNGGLVDFLIPASFLNTDFHIPIDDFRREMAPNHIPIYGSVEAHHASQIQTPESLRACAMCLFEDGADGMLIFNFPDWDLQHVALPPYYWLKDLDTYEKTLTKPLLFSLEHEMFRVPDIELPYQLPANIEPGSSTDLTINLPNGAFPYVHALALLDSGTDVALSINNQPVKDLNNKFRQRRSLFPDEIIECRQIPNYDNSDSRFRIFRIDPNTLVPGNNTLKITNTSGQNVKIDRVNIGMW